MRVWVYGNLRGCRNPPSTTVITGAKDILELHDIAEGCPVPVRDHSDRVRCDRDSIRFGGMNRRHGAGLIGRCRFRAVLVRFGHYYTSNINTIAIIYFTDYGPSEVSKDCPILRCWPMDMPALNSHTNILIAIYRTHVSAQASYNP